ncbi:unnamed protein product [Mytilus coruscus]|uniref:Uncharacterized protein n=1 Tax=Mytilus coruscus TaxID=42192 RepID=A0A6J8A6Z3_MYTCO|nr:unnamed protein product [Mytilus coruscus]
MLIWNFLILEGELRGLGLETADDLSKVMKLRSFKCYWNRVYIVGPYFSGKSCLAKLLVGDVLPKERESTDGIWIYMGRAGMDVNGEEWIVLPKGKAVEEILVAMMMTLSTDECMDIANQTKRLNESEINPHNRQISMDGNNVGVLTVDNFPQSDVHTESIFESPPRENCDDHDYTFTACISDQNSQICDTANKSNFERKTTAADTESHALRICVAATNTSGLFPEENRTSDVNELEYSSSEMHPKKSSTSHFLSDECIPSEIQPKEIRSSELIFSEIYSPGVDKAQSIASTDTSAVGSITVETVLETKKSKDHYSVAGIRMPTVSSVKKRFQSSQKSNDYFDLTTKSESCTAIYIKKDRGQSNKSVREKFREKLMKEVADELSHDQLHEMVISSIREGKYKQKIIPIDIWDFGGQKDYYMTHQLFITSRGIFVLVFNGSLNLHKHMPDLSFLPGHFGKPTIAVYLLHWVNSILTYCKRSDDGFPKIVFVATHKDKIRKNFEKHKQKVMTVIQDIFESHAGLKHLEFKPLIFVNAMNEADPEIQALRQRLMDRAKEHPRWGEQMPTAWVPLELHLAKQVEKGVNILTMEQLQMFNSQNQPMVLTDKQLETFLKVQHSLGKLLYFDVANLRDFIIIAPGYLVEVLRSIVTEKQFWPKGKQLQSIFHTMEKTGALSRDDFDVLWKQQMFEHILSYKDFIIEVLVHLDVLVAERRTTNDLSTSPHKVSKFIVPSMITRSNNTNYLRTNCKIETSILLSYKFTEKVIPPAFPYRFIASFVDMWGVKMYKNKKRMLFSDLAVVEVDDKHDVAVQVIENRVIVSLIHAETKEHIVPTIATSVQECLTAAVHRISEFYSTLSADSSTTDKRSELHMVMPFEIEFGVHCKKTLCFFLHNKIPTATKWQCSEHKVYHDVSCLKLWFSEKIAYKLCDSLSQVNKYNIDYTAVIIRYPNIKHTVYVMKSEIPKLSDEHDLP